MCLPEKNQFYDKVLCLESEKPYTIYVYAYVEINMFIFMLIAQDVSSKISHNIYDDQNANFIE